MQHLEVSCAVRPLKWSLGVKWITQQLQAADDTGYFSEIDTSFTMEIK